MQNPFVGSRLLVLAPHPDDETLACGGTIARAKKVGAEVCVMAFCTGTLKQYGSSSQEDTRVNEFNNAMRALDVDDWEIIFPSEYHMRLDTLPQIEIIKKIESETRLSITNFEPDIVFFPGPSYNQDHAAVSAACLAVLRPYHISMRHSPALSLQYSHVDEAAVMGQWSSNWAPNFWVDISSEIDAKERALSCYRSQLKSGLNHYRTIDGMRNANYISGKKAGLAYAEEFKCLRSVI